MLKRYINYIISSDDEEENDNKNVINNNLQKKENNVIDNNKNFKNLGNFEEKIAKKNKFDSAKEEKTIIKKVLFCELCSKRLESNQDYVLHMSSKKHKNKRKELLKKELKECGSFRKVLVKEKMISSCRRWRVNNIRYLLYGFSLNQLLNK